MAKTYRFKNNKVDYALIQELLETGGYDEDCADLSDLVEAGLLEEIPLPEGMDEPEFPAIIMPEDYVPFPEEPDIKPLYEMPEQEDGLPPFPLFAPPLLDSDILSGVSIEAQTRPFSPQQPVTPPVFPHFMLPDESRETAKPPIPFDTLMEINKKAHEDGLKSSTGPKTGKEKE